MVDRLPDAIGVIGSRGPDPSQGRTTGFTDYSLVLGIAKRAVAAKPNIQIVSGGAPSGVDAMIRHACLRELKFCDADHIRRDPTSVDCERPHFHEFKAAWRNADGSKNARAGFERNDLLVRHVGLLLALYAPGEPTPGTRHAIERARAHNIPVMIYQEGVWR